jgi:TolB-like protein/DNA-binding winged helix-turn-helix (wHTH) protein/Tfp pilus assembly protein PilF
MQEPASIIRFGPFEWRARHRELYRDGSKLRIRPQPQRVLELLISHAGDIVTREDLRRQIWSAEMFVDFEHGLNTSIKEIRAVLGDSASNPIYIETLPKIGYRFKAPIEAISTLASSSPPVGSPPPANPETSSSVPQSFARQDQPSTNRAPAKLYAALALAAVALLLAGIALYHWHGSRQIPPPPSEIKMVAVLPFENLTGDANQEYLSDGLTEEMITQLGRLDTARFGVIARTSVMHYKHTAQSLPEIGRELGVQYVLEGTVRREKTDLRINAELVQVDTQKRLWSRQYDREFNNLLDLQGEIAQEVSDEIQSTLGDGRKRSPAARALAVKPTISPEAYDLYLKGLFFLNKRTVEGFQQAADFFQQAIDKDPNYARAYAGLADTYALMASYGMSSQNELLSKARFSALKALQLDDTLAEAHASLALIAENKDRDWPTAEREYRRAIELQPDYATAHHWYAECLAFQGRFSEAFAEINRARQRDPLSLIIGADYAAILYFSRQYDRSIEEFRRVQLMEPNFPRSYLIINSLIEKGDYDGALASLKQWAKIPNTETWVLTMRVCVYGRAHRMPEAQQSFDQLLRLNHHLEVDPVQWMVAYLAMGRKDEAIASLQQAQAANSPYLNALKVDPFFDPLRSDPRFQQVLHNMNLQ